MHIFHFVVGKQNETAKKTKVKQELITDETEKKPKIKQELITDHMKVEKKRKVFDRFNGTSKEELMTRTLPDRLKHGLDIVFIGKSELDKKISLT
jgi:hypothetical protein